MNSYFETLVFIGRRFQKRVGSSHPLKIRLYPELTLPPCMIQYGSLIKVDKKFMALAIEEAKKAFEKREVPIGAVIVKDDEIIAGAHNLKETFNNAIYHAEILAIRDACDFLGTWRLTGCTIYVTIEPCPMCAGAILQSRIKRIVIGAMDAKSGACGSVINLLNNPGFNHQAEIETGILEEECSQLMGNFFKFLRYK